MVNGYVPRTFEPMWFPCLGAELTGKATWAAPPGPYNLAHYAAIMAAVLVLNPRAFSNPAACADLGSLCGFRNRS